MEMVKYLATIAFVLSLTAADSAMALGRHCRGGNCGGGGCGAGGCSTGGCAGGVCYAPVGPSKMAATTNVPPGLAADATAAAPAVAAAQPQTAQTYAYNTGRRGLFGRR